LLWATDAGIVSLSLFLRLTVFLPAKSVPDEPKA